MRGLKLRKSKSDKDIVSEIRKLRHWTRKEESDERNSPEGEDVNTCLLEETGDNSSTTSSNTHLPNNNVSIDSACDPDFEILAACKYKRAQMVRMVSTADSGIDIQITAPSPVHKPSKIGRQFRRAYSCKGRTSSLYLGESSSMPSKQMTLSDNHLDSHNKNTGYRIYRVRSFSTTNNSIINKGDSFKIRPNKNTGPKQNRHLLHHAHTLPTSHTNNSLSASAAASATSNASRRSTVRAAIRRSYFSSDCIVSQAQQHNPSVAGTDWSYGRTVSLERLPDVDNEDEDSYDEEEGEEGGGEEGDLEEDTDGIPVFKVAVLGSQGVGKTTVTQQLLTSEYLQNSSCDVTLGE